MLAMIPCFVFAIFATGASGLSVVTTSNHGQNQSAATFMVVSGITGAHEFCLSAENGRILARLKVLFFLTIYLCRR